jgi:dethiobiotin synthetase
VLTEARRRPGLFVTGTDTGVGKTTIGVALLRHAAGRGRRLVPFKPAETGCAPDPQDAHRLWDAARAATPRASTCLYALPLPAAPKAAAEQAGITISLEAILRRADELAAHADGLVVEGAGGLLVPYAPRLTGADLATALGLPALVVARTALGTVNHVALTVSELRRRAIPLAGIILVASQREPSPHDTTNAPLIADLTGVRPIGIFPHTPEPHDADTLASLLSEAVGADPLATLGL